MSFWSERTFFRLPSCVARKMRCLKLRTVRLAFFQSMVFQSVCISVPFAKRSCACIQLFPQSSNFHIVLWVMHQNHVSHLSVWVSLLLALSAQLWFPVAFRLAAFASWFFLFPLRDSAFLAVGLLSVSTTSETSLGFPRSAWMRYGWGGCLPYCGDWVSTSVIQAPTETTIPSIIVSADFDDQKSRSFEDSFTFIHPAFL
jgi:hypothetical protein